MKKRIRPETPALSQKQNHKTTKFLDKLLSDGLQRQTQIPFFGGVG